MKERKTMKKMFALVVAFAMLLTMSTTVFAATNEDANGSSADTVDVKITNLTGEPSVTLYKIAEATYSGTGAGTFTGYNWAEGISDTMIAEAQTGLTADSITAIVNGIKDGTVTPLATVTNVTVAKDGTYTYTAAAGAYIAVITGATDGTVYNPILLTATYNDEGLKGGEISATSNYLFGTIAVAKSSNPAIDKEVSDTVKDENDEGEEIDTVSVGDVVTYTLTPTLPSYPDNAVNKTLYISDTLSAGLDFIDGSIVITVDKDTLTPDGNNFVDADGDVVATLVEKDGTTFNLNFVYDELVVSEDGSTADVVITYKAVVNENAVVGSAGNDNTVTLYYANDPSEGSTYDPENPDSPDPDEAEDLTSTEDTETVYTYQIAFHKIGEGADDEGLAGAIFEIRDADDNLVDTVITNEAGYAVSSKVSKGTYTVKEIEAPDGYSLNTTPFDVEATWVTATKTVESSTTSTKYSTTAPSDDAEQVGWIVDGTFYEMDAYTDETADEADAQAAYIVDETETSITEISTEENTAGAGTAVYGQDVLNTPMSALPSTGGVGTFVFTIAGCLIMVAAVAIFMVSKKKASN